MDVDLTCILYKNGDEVATLNPGEKDYTVSSEDFDPEACYNVFCEMAKKRDGGADFIKILSSGSKSEHDCWGKPRWWAGNRRGCRDVGDSCEDAFIQIKALNNIGTGVECDSKNIQFACAETPMEPPTDPPAVPSEEQSVSSYLPITQSFQWRLVTKQSSN